MKKLIFALVFLAACSPEYMPPPKQAPKTQRCGTVGDKKYMNPPGDTTLANRTYWVLFSPDTAITCPPGVLYCGIANYLQVPKSVYDTIIERGRGNRYCY